MRDDQPATPANAHRYPLFLDLRGRHVLVVGGTRAAARKLTRLLAAGARVTLIAPRLGTTLRTTLRATSDDEFLPIARTGETAGGIGGDGPGGSGGVRYLAREWRAEDVDRDGICLVIAASGRLELDRAVAAAATARGLFVNVANEPGAGSALVPSLVERLPLSVAVSSGGASPALARLLTARLEAFLPSTWRDLANLAARYRGRVAERVADWRERRRFWESRLNGRVGNLVLQGRTAEAEEALERALERHAGRAAEGEVWLVGAGPGDPDLLSFRALRLMQQADVVLHDRLVSEPIMRLVPPGVERIYVGKRRSDHALPQQSINERLVELALAGRRVLRLKGGDPFIFGRGGEEIDTLAAHGIPFQVVPGITAAAGCASYAGIPLTHRDHAQACIFVTGHLKDGSVDLNWTALVQPQQTVVVYMGLVGLPLICRELVRHGLPATTPAAIVSQGTLADQRVLAGTLASLPGLVDGADIRPPTLIIVGDVVRLRERLAWYPPR